MTISAKRKRELHRIALKYAGEVLIALVDTYEAFNELDEDERAFMDDSVTSIGDRLYARGVRK
jgi:hypothetical protein